MSLAQPLLSPARLERQIESLAAGHFLTSPETLLRNSLSLLRPPEQISTLECAEKYRLIRNTQGTGKRNWSLALTPYMVGPMDAMDNPGVREVIVPKPGRSGGTVGFENYIFKKMRFGPMGDVLWYLSSTDEVKSYCDKQVSALFEDHPEIQAKVGAAKSDDNITRKRVAGRWVEYLPANSKKMTGRQAETIIFDEVDTFSPVMCASALAQSRVRGRTLGNKRKVGMASHPDRGWTTGIASAWSQSSRGIYVWSCSECQLWSSPYPTKFWPDVPRTKLQYQKAEPGADDDERIAMAEKTAAMLCPHCGSVLDDKQRHEMTDNGQWMHRGQTLDFKLGIIGEADKSQSLGFWIHGLMLKTITNQELARDFETALAKYDRTKKVETLKEVTAKVFGEVFEGAGNAANLDAAELARRAKEAAKEAGSYEIGSVPKQALFVTSSVDVGHAKFDVSIRGWDIEGRSWQIDRFTIRQREWDDGVLRDIRPTERIEDWLTLEGAVLDRLIPFSDNSEMALPVAVMLLDAGDGNVAWKAYEFARRMNHKKWGNWPRVKLIKGASSPKATELPAAPLNISKDEHGRALTPIVSLFTLGVTKLREQAVERLAVTDGGPGQCYFPKGFSRKHYEEFFGEKKIDGKWERTGDNESLDLFGYDEAGRLMLKPERSDINWKSGIRPPWATPVSLQAEGGDPVSLTVKAPPQPAKPNIYDRHRRMNRNTNFDG